MAGYSIGGVSGAHLNPAVSLGIGLSDVPLNLQNGEHIQHVQLLQNEREKYVVLFVFVYVRKAIWHHGKWYECWIYMAIQMFFGSTVAAIVFRMTHRSEYG